MDIDEEARASLDRGEAAGGEDSGALEHDPSNAHIAQLRQDVLSVALAEGRMVGTPGHDLVRDHLMRRVAGLSLEPYAGGRYELPYNVGSMRGCNVIGVVPGADSNLPPLLIAAHYDSVIAAPCADDNAAAVAIALRLAERIRPGRLERDLVVAFFDAEEPPYFQCPQMGSIRFFEDQMDGRGVHCAVVMDLVGHDVPVDQDPVLRNAASALGMGRELELLRDLVFMTGAESHAELPGVVRGTLELRALRLVAALNRYIGDMSDHHVFRISGVPYLFFSCGRWQHYHRPTDTQEKLNFEKMLLIAEFLEELMGQLDMAELAGPPGAGPAGAHDPVASPYSELEADPEDDTLEFELETLHRALGRLFPLLPTLMRQNELRKRSDMDAVARLLLGLGL